MRETLNQFISQSKKTGRKASVVVLTYNRWEWTEMTLNSLFKNTFFPHDLIVVDNHSTDGTVEKLKQLSREDKIDMLILLSRNYGVSAGFNIGWKIADFNHWFVKLDNDIKLAPYWLSSTCLAAEQPGIGVVGTGVSMMYRIIAEKRKITNIHGVKAVDVYWTVAGLIVVSKATLNRIGYFREDIDKGELRLYCIEDTEYTERARAFKLRTVYVLDLDCRHIPELLAEKTGKARMQVEAEKYPEYRKWKVKVGRIKRGRWLTGQYARNQRYETRFTKSWITPYIFKKDLICS